MNKLFLSPHSDDAALFGAFTLQREKPLVLTVTNSFIQANRGESITWQERQEEDIVAMNILGCPLVFGSLRDDVLDEWAVKNLLEKFHNFDTIYAPALQGGNPQHDLISTVAMKIFTDKVIYYATYQAGEWYTEGTRRVVGTREMKKAKEQALSCYRSQLELPATKGHFDAVKNKDEWYL